MEKLEKSVSIFKSLGDMTRLRIVEAIIEGEKSVNSIANELQMSQSAISHQLKNLKNNDLVRSKRRGKEVYYRLSDEHVKTMINQVFDHTSHKHDE